MDIPNVFRTGPNYTKLRTNLRLVVNRLKLLEKKRTELAQKARVEIAEYIRAGKIDRAKIRIEHIIREDYMVESMEMLEMYADLLLARFGLIETTPDLDDGLKEAVASIVWATSRLQSEVPEIDVVCNELLLKYGKEFIDTCRQNTSENVSEKLVYRMGISVPPQTLIEKYMVLIADTYKVPYEPDRSVLNAEDMILLKESSTRFVQDPQTNAVSAPPRTPVARGGTNYPPDSKNFSQNSNGNVRTPDIGFSLPDVPSSAAAPGPPTNDSMNFDDLEERFNRLKKKR